MNKGMAIVTFTNKDIVVRWLLLVHWRVHLTIRLFVGLLHRSHPCTVRVTERAMHFGNQTLCSNAAIRWQ